MSTPPFSRRAFLKATAVAVPVAAIPLHELRAKGLEDVHLQHYKPVFFTAAEWAFVLAACDRLIPAEGNGPGALETNVPVFIDQQLHDGLGADIYLQGPHDPKAPATLGFQLPYAPQDIYRHGIRLAQQAAHAQHGKPFERLAAAQQDAFLTALQKNGVDFAALGEASLKASQFFSQLLGDTKNGYLADPKYGGNKDMKAWVAIGFPGARGQYVEWVDQHNVKYPLGPVSLSGKRA
ncbi:gluconate 2-dehydrogenase subunit 3 family protein [Cupriavidus sp. D384]|uniref:gluconate 2-dehydrogenase subunit 3 family protein n=1 Tax=Cupriavidus sp. D384 TaxID=1538095 RepID=UPI00083031AF|nr:gluconate 2-dehydrogenase subunit 3 family protein [Cupriavidus sp. D384]